MPSLSPQSFGSTIPVLSALLIALLCCSSAEGAPSKQPDNGFFSFLSAQASPAVKPTAPSKKKIMPSAAIPGKTVQKTAVAKLKPVSPTKVVSKTTLTKPAIKQQPVTATGNKKPVTTTSNQSTQTKSSNVNTAKKAVVAPLNASKPVESTTPTQQTTASIAPASQALGLTAGQKELIRPETQAELEKLSTAMRFEAKSISYDIQDQQEDTLKDVAMLWQAAVERSHAIRFAIEKLSRQDETGKPLKGDSLGKRIAQSATRVAGVASSMVTASPAGLIGSSVVEQILLDDPSQSVLQHVTDADMVILAKEVEDLQNKVIESYYRYRQTQERLGLTQEARQNLSQYYNQFTTQSETNDPSIETILSSLYESAKQDEDEAKQAYHSARNNLGMLVGPDALGVMETDRAGSTNKQQDS